MVFRNRRAAGSKLENMSWVSSARSPRRCRLAGAVFCAGEHLRQHRQLADHRFKRIDTSFVDLIPDRPTSQLAGSVTAEFAQHQHGAGRRQSASVATFMAINGDGFFAVQKPGASRHRPVFNGVDHYTRRGDFQINKSGYLVNGAGYYLMGIPVDPKTGNLTGSVPEVLQFQNDFLPAQPTTKIDYRANLASYPLTTTHDRRPGLRTARARRRSVAADPLALAARGALRRCHHRRHRAIIKDTPQSPSPARRCCRARRPASRSPPISPPATPSRSSAPIITFEWRRAPPAPANVTGSISTLLGDDRLDHRTAIPPSSPAAPITLNSAHVPIHGHQLDLRRLRRARLHRHRDGAAQRRRHRRTGQVIGQRRFDLPQ